MGSGRFDSTAYATFSNSTVGRSTEQVYKSRGMVDSLNPMGVKLRESRDSTDNPKSTPLIVALDVTGSMGMLADTIARQGLGVLFNSILTKKPITDPHLMFMAVGDANCDSAPLQVSQFEADNRIVEQLTQIYLEHGGGGNNYESYNLPWYFASFHTVHDSMEKRGKRGYLFTVGDEEAPHELTHDQIQRVCGDDLKNDLSSEQMLQLAQDAYDVYHIIIEEGDYARHQGQKVVDSWRNMLGQKVILLSDHTKLAETIVSAIEVAEGIDAKASADHWTDASDIVHRAVKSLPVGSNVATRVVA